MSNRGRFFVRVSGTVLAPPPSPVSSLSNLVDLVKHYGPGSDGFAEGQTAPCVRYPSIRRGIVIALDYAKPRTVRQNRGI